VSRAFDAWTEGGLIEVTLPSGLRVRGRLPMVQELILDGRVPSFLVSAAMALQGKPAEDFDDSERATFIEWQRLNAAAFIREVWDPETQAWEPEVATPEKLLKAPPEDVDALEDLAMRIRTAEQVTAHARFVAGEISGDELQRVMREGAARTVRAWSTFRSPAGGHDRGPDGTDVADPPQPDPRGDRQRRRPRARSGAGLSASV
jgi:hypothetical protein